ncbi:MAG: hypothetical protein ACOWYE_06285 [Desulfatiglandales bacterium]
MNETGLREVSPECFQCPERVSCLRVAMETREGLEMRAEMLEREPARGMMGKIKRWSRKKTLSRLVRQEKQKI